MPAAKSLSQHVREGTFRPRRHYELLAGAAVRWPVLAAIQDRYRRAGSYEERRRLAREFAHAAGRVGHVSADVREEILHTLEPGRKSLPARSNPLRGLVLAATFNAGRDAVHLEGELLPEECPLRGREEVWALLRHLQWLYQLAEVHATLFGRGRLRRALANEYSIAVRVLHGRRAPSWMQEELDL